MQKNPEQERMESIRSFESSIRKLEKALVQMTAKQADTALVAKRLKAHETGLAALEHRLSPAKDLSEELSQSCDVLKALLPSLEAQLSNPKAGRSQKTLLERRVRATLLALQLMERTDLE